MFMRIDELLETEEQKDPAEEKGLLWRQLTPLEQLWIQINRSKWSNQWDIMDLKFREDFKKQLPALVQKDLSNPMSTFYIHAQKQGILPNQVDLY